MAEWFRDPGQLLGALKQHAQPGKRVPTIVGYDDLRELGRGGQGVVYTAVQVSTKRDVAIKLLLDGAWASDDRRRRFEREIDLIAALRHPNIVRLYDSGVTDEGYPYYVMEYIEGMCLDEMIGVAATASRQQFDDSLDARVLPPRDPQPLLKPRPILEVVAKVADAVHYAHQRGVIHRDLKPSNIRIDAEIEPQVLDFGLAKSALGVGLSDVTAPMSHTGEFMGSLPWASPEQAEGVPDKIDLRTDIYSLGVMLFQLLTGQFPYGVTGSFREVLDNILHTEPRRPSHVRKQIDDDVDTIVLKCLTKEPERRYQTAGELATDIRHYLAGEPIEAKRDSTLYNLRKTMRRYQYAARLIGVFTIIAIGTAIVTARLWIQAVESRQLAEDRLVAVEKARAEVVEARDRAERERNQALAINRFLTRMLESPMTSGREARVAEVLDQAAREVEQSRALEPDIEATLRATIGSAYYTLGMYPEAGEQLRRALEIRRKAHGEENAEVAASLRDLALFLCDTGDA
ncbi:MAG: serine/threonine protein kinase, partial [Phycisphaerae bacterium]|nr:serine/threonine protein kinase [Phycisphaerae bacterium]